MLHTSFVLTSILIVGKLLIAAGTIFGQWTVLREVRARGPHRRYECRCSCGRRGIVFQTHLQARRSVRCRPCGIQVSAGKNKGLTRNVKHGETRRRKRSPEFETWSSIKQRCHNQNYHGYRLYGGRGIRVALEWRNDFTAFLAHIGRRPSLKHSIDRIDNARGYEPGNVRWATRIMQARNRRTNRVIEVNGVRRVLAEWAEVTGLKGKTIEARLRREWTPEASMVPLPKVK